MAYSAGKIVRRIGLALWLALPFILWILPADFFDVGQSICPSKVFLGIECPGCGLIRATQHMMHLEFSAAWSFNKLIVITFPICVLLYLHILGNLVGRPIFGFLRNFY